MTLLTFFHLAGNVDMLGGTLTIILDHEVTLKEEGTAG